jgi:hypothetical protein
MNDRPTPRTDAHARSMPGFADQWVPRYISEELERELAELAALYPRVIAACLRCDPIPACEREDDQLEPPWDVIDRVRRQRDDALEQLAAMTDQRDAALMTIRLAQRTAGED